MSGKTKLELQAELEEMRVKYLLASSDLRDEKKLSQGLGEEVNRLCIELKARESADDLADEFAEEIKHTDAFDGLIMDGDGAATAIEVYLVCQRAAYNYFVHAYRGHYLLGLAKAYPEEEQYDE